MTDPWIAVAVLFVVLAVFLAGLLVPRRPRTVRAPLTDAKLDAINMRLSTIESNQVALETRQTNNDHDVRNIRQAMENMPTIRSMHAVELKVAELAGKVENVSTSIAAVTSGVDRIESFLMDATAKAIASQITEVRK